MSTHNPEMMTVPTRDLEQIGQQIHQAYHQGIDGTWKTCKMGVCDRLQQIMAESGYQLPVRESEDG